MPTLLAVKFQDHYEVLGIDPEAVSETIHRAYGLLAQKYHPRNSVTGNAEMFDGVNLAYEVLSDPIRRREFDELKGVGQETGGPKFSSSEFFDALGREAVLRSAILCLLYDRRRRRPSSPSLSMRHIETMVEATAIELSSALWYLKQRALAASDDKSSLQITVDGMDFLLGNRPVPGDVMAFIKPSARAISHAAAPQAQLKALPAPARDPESVLSTLHRALARTSD
jgi:curved DNA-binding protein CbpA